MACPETELFKYFPVRERRDLSPFKRVIVHLRLLLLQFDLRTGIACFTWEEKLFVYAVYLTLLVLCAWGAYKQLAVVVSLLPSSSALEA
jgi:hypothetical protein